MSALGAWEESGVTPSLHLTCSLHPITSTLMSVGADNRASQSFQQQLQTCRSFSHEMGLRCHLRELPYGELSRGLRQVMWTYELGLPWGPGAPGQSMSLRGWWIRGSEDAPEAARRHIPARGPRGPAQTRSRGSLGRSQSALGWGQGPCADEGDDPGGQGGLSGCCRWPSPGRLLARVLGVGAGLH